MKKRCGDFACFCMSLPDAGLGLRAGVHSVSLCNLKLNLNGESNCEDLDPHTKCAGYTSIARQSQHRNDDTVRPTLYLRALK